jgi:hypothetical protein
MNDRIEALGIDVLVTDTVMASDEDRVALTAEILEWSAGLTRLA